MRRQRLLSIAAFAGFLFTGTAQAVPTIGTGWDLWQTQLGTQFQGKQFVGIQLETYDFGTNAYGVDIGVRGVGSADTIIQRLQEATVPFSVPPPLTAATIDIEMVAWRLRSLGQVDFGPGLDDYFLTLQSLRGGPASVGTMTITFNQDPIVVDVPSYGSPNGQPFGTFDSTINVAFDLRKGCLTCDIIFSDTLALTTNNTPWGRLPPNKARLIAGANYWINGKDRQIDFWPGGFDRNGNPIPTDHVHADFAALHRAAPAPMPEPATWAMLIVGFGLVGSAARRRRGTTAAAIV